MSCSWCSWFVCTVTYVQYVSFRFVDMWVMYYTLHEPYLRVSSVWSSNSLIWILCRCRCRSLCLCRLVELRAIRGRQCAEHRPPERENRFLGRLVLLVDGTGIPVPELATASRVHDGERQKCCRPKEVSRHLRRRTGVVRAAVSRPYGHTLRRVRASISSPGERLFARALLSVRLRPRPRSTRSFFRLSAHAFHAFEGVSHFRLDAVKDAVGDERFASIHGTGSFSEECALERVFVVRLFIFIFLFACDAKELLLQIRSLRMACVCVDSRRRSQACETSQATPPERTVECHCTFIIISTSYYRYSSCRHRSRDTPQRARRESALLMEKNFRSKRFPERGEEGKGKKRK